VTKEEKIKHYATAKRATAGTISQLIDGNFKTYWVGKLRGMVVSYAGKNYKFDTKEKALECARSFRQSCIDEANSKGIAL